MDYHGPQGVECHGAPIRRMGDFWQRRFRRRWSTRIIVEEGDTSHRGRRTKSKVSNPHCGLGTGIECRKEQIQEALRRAKEGSQPVRPNPDTIQAEAVAKVARLQRALDAFGGLGGPEVDAIKKALKKASRGRTRTTHCRICQRVQGFHRALHQTSHQVEGGVGVRDRIVGGGSCSVGEVGSTTGSASWGTSCGKRGPHVELQQMVNQWQVECDSLSQELRGSRAPKARPWCGDGPPDVSVIRTMPDHFHILQGWLNTRNRELRDALEFRSPDVRASIRQEAPGTRMSALIDAAGAKRRCLDGRHWCRVEFWWLMKTNYKLW